ncbi:MAG: Gldg family protein [Lachnospiraceae bacterium]|nr:Gldg family protein [Lachnospiraceae bacterium]
MIAIYKRELRSFFHSFIGFLFIAVNLFFLGLYCTIYNLMNSYPYFSYAIAGCMFVFLFSVPILTMRVMADDRRNRTDQLILTAPVSVGRIVIGKYLATLTVFAIPCAIICLYPLVLSRFGKVPYGETYVAILGFFLYGAACIAIGVLVSSLTENIVIAAVLCFVVLFVGYMMPGLCGLISETGNLLTKILGCFDIYTPFESLLGGTLDLTAVVYYLTLIALALFLSAQAVQKRRYSISVRQLRFGAFSTGMIVVAVAIAVLVNALVRQLPEEKTVIDVTSNRLYTLTDQTREYVDTMAEDVTIYVWSAEDSMDQTVVKTLDRYASLSDHIRVEYVDPRVNPRFYTSYAESAPTAGSLIVVSDLRSKVIEASDLYESTYAYDESSYYGYSEQVTGYDAEGQITAALNYVLSEDMPVVYLITGHGERSLETSYTSALAKANVTSESLHLMDVDAIPDDAAALMILGPTSDLSADDVEKVTAYLERGGKVMITLTMTEEELPNLQSLLAYMGLSTESGIVVEESAEHYYRNPFFELPEMSYSTYTAGVNGTYYVFSPYNCGLRIPEDTDEITYDVFLKSSDDAFLMKDYVNATDYSQKEGDPDGPFALGVEAVKTLDASGDATADGASGDADGDATADGASADAISATMIVLASAETFTEAADEMVSGANRTVFMNIVSAFSDQELNVSIPAKSYDMQLLSVTQAGIIRLGVLLVILLPLGCLIAGFVIWMRRRRR